jgi:hypothetical protein
MMASERTPSTPLDPATISELRVALGQSVESGDHGPQLKSLLARAATEARQKGIQAEQLLISLKDVWYSLPHLATNPADERQTRLLQQLIARCIQEYYGG